MDKLKNFLEEAESKGIKMDVNPRFVENTPNAESKLRALLDILIQIGEEGE